MRIVFLGTPDFAVTSLKAIVEAGYNIVGVVTAPDKPAGRGMQLQQSPVKKYALEQGLTVLQPTKLKDLDFLQALRQLNADLQVVIAFRMLPVEVWQMPKFGTINLHASLLPDYRGAAPINWAIINGEIESGVCTFFLKHEIDTGDILLQAKTPIGLETTAGELHDTLMNLGAKVMLESLKLIESGQINGKPQGNNSYKTAPKIFKSHCEIHWDQSSEKILNLIRGMSPYPAAFTHLNGKIVKVYKASASAIQKAEIGKIETDGKTYLRVACTDAWIHLLEVQQESKKRMEVQEFLRGFKLYP